MEEFNRELMHKFCHAVRVYRGLTQEEVAERLGVDVRTVQNAEYGPHAPCSFVLSGYQKLATERQLKRYTEAFQLPPVSPAVATSAHCELEPAKL